MNDLTEFLLARIAGDEHDAYHAQGLLGVVTEWHEVEALRARGLTRADARHVHRWSAARVLAECEVKRRIVDAYLDERSRRDVYQRDDARAVEDDEQAARRRSSAARCRGLEIAVEALALPYADHPDYREEWRP